MTTKIPDAVPGHWETPAGKQMAEGYVDSPRIGLCMGDVSDFVLANEVYMLDRHSLDLLAYQTAAKDRIRWLSVQLALAKEFASFVREGCDQALPSETLLQQFRERAVAIVGERRG